MRNIDREFTEEIELNTTENPFPREYHYVMRTHSHTDKQQLWKVMSRPIIDLSAAEAWLHVVKVQNKNPKHHFFILTSSEIIQ